MLACLTAVYAGIFPSRSNGSEKSGITNAICMPDISCQNTN